MIKTRIDTFKIAHGVKLAGSNYADDMRELLAKGSPQIDSPIAVKAESKVSALDSKFARKSTESKSKRIRKGFPPVSQESLDWLSGLVGRNRQDPA